MLEELVKKLPGAEIDDDGNIKINGKEVKKIMVDGKEFFGSLSNRAFIITINHRSRHGYALATLRPRESCTGTYQ